MALAAGRTAVFGVFQSRLGQQGSIAQKRRGIRAERRQRENLHMMRGVTRIAQRHPEIPAAVIDTITRSLVNKLMHGPSERLRALDDVALSRELALLFDPGTDNE